METITAAKTRTITNGTFSGDQLGSERATNVGSIYAKKQPRVKVNNSA